MDMNKKFYVMRVTQHEQEIDCIGSYYSHNAAFVDMEEDMEEIVNDLKEITCDEVKHEIYVSMAHVECGEKSYFWKIMKL